MKKVVDNYEDFMSNSYMVSMLKHIKPFPFKVGDKVELRTISFGDQMIDKIKSIGKGYIVFEGNKRKMVFEDMMDQVFIKKWKK